MGPHILAPTAEEEKDIWQNHLYASVIYVLLEQLWAWKGLQTENIKMSSPHIFVCQINFTLAVRNPSQLNSEDAGSTDNKQPPFLVRMCAKFSPQLTSKSNFLPAWKAAILFLVFIRSLVTIGRKLCSLPHWLWWRGEKKNQPPNCMFIYMYIKIALTATNQILKSIIF